jgi:hypothetical protein
MSHSTRENDEHDASDRHSDPDSGSDQPCEIDGNHPVESVVDNLQETAESNGDEQISVGEVVDSFGRRSYGPLLAVPALIALIPVIGGIPGVSIITATIILFVCVQMLIWNEGVWLPERLRQLHLPANKVSQGAKQSKSWVSWSDGFIAPRLKFLSQPPCSYITPVVCTALAISMYPLALVPMGVAPPAAAILFLAIGIVAGDGALLLVGYAAALACGGFLYYTLS